MLNTCTSSPHRRLQDPEDQPARGGHGGPYHRSEKRRYSIRSAFHGGRMSKVRTLLGWSAPTDILNGVDGVLASNLGNYAPPAQTRL